MNHYIGHPLQIRGAEEYVLQGGKGQDMHFLYVRNGLGLEAWISLDRAGDVSRVSFKGENMGYFAPCGYVSSRYYDDKGDGFLKSFTAGFFTTCGLTAVGTPCEDEGEQLPLHGTISHQPARLLGIEEGEDLSIRLEIRDSALFGRKLIMQRTYFFSYSENTFSVQDTVTNEGSKVSPFMILYHCNMGYPLLTEKSDVRIPHHLVTPRNDHAAEHLTTCLQMEAPQEEYEECCYYYDVKEKEGQAKAGIFSENAGVVISYDKRQLPYFTQWKMMGQGEYVLGLEPGNCTPDGRDVLRKRGTLSFLQPGQSAKAGVKFTFVTEKEKFEGVF